jgi:hypothetical protein
MVRFEDDKLVIEISAGSKNSSVETWLDLQSELLYVIRWINQESVTDKFYVLPDFLGNLLPDYKSAIKMTK